MWCFVDGGAGGGGGGQLLLGVLALVIHSPAVEHGKSAVTLALDAEREEIFFIHIWCGGRVCTTALLVGGVDARYR